MRRSYPPRLARPRALAPKAALPREHSTSERRPPIQYGAETVQRSARRTPARPPLSARTSTSFRPHGRHTAKASTLARSAASSSRVRSLSSRSAPFLAPPRRFFRVSVLFLRIQSGQDGTRIRDFNSDFRGVESTSTVHFQHAEQESPILPADADHAGTRCGRGAAIAAAMASRAGGRAVKGRGPPGKAKEGYSRSQKKRKRKYIYKS